MDRYKYLILKRYDEKNKIEDITDDVERITLSGQRCYVKFKNNSTVYNDNRQRVKIYENPTLELNNKALFYKGSPIGDFLTALRFDKLVKIIFKSGSSKIFDIKSITFKDLYRINTDEKTSFFNYL
ncbi:MAG: hypothetical protein K2K31_00270, partial [Clostridia bacterium]|nr:hypothetical protein [Clostridia bacterium]